MSTKVTALGPLRHECLACGHCCHGHRVRLEDEAEVALVMAQGVALGVEDPVEDGAMRVVNGGCVFLDASQKCRIHSTFGGTKKPRICQQYPLRMGLTEVGWRIGVDPGCTNTWRSWRNGPELAAQPLVQPHDNRREHAPAEVYLLQVAGRPGMTIAGLLADIAATPPSAELPDGFAGRLVARLQAAHLDRFLAVEAVGAGIRNPLAHVPAVVAALDPQAAPGWGGRLDAESDAFAIEVVRRHLFLRVGDEPLPEVGQVLVLLAGAVTCAWADPRPEVFGPALSAWAKATRHRAFWAALVPRPETLAWLATGERSSAEGSASGELS